MAKHNNTVINSPQKSLLGDIPTKKGGDKAIQDHHLSPALSDPMSDAPIDCTFYVDIPFGGANTIANSPQKSDITKLKGKK